jgi:hypothetical protein
VDASPVPQEPTTDEHVTPLPAGRPLPPLPTEVSAQQLVADLAASLREAAQELGAVHARLERGSRHLAEQARQYADSARTLIDAGNYSAAAADCHRAHQCRLQAAALDAARTVPL